jgi:hypothetical protein
LDRPIIILGAPRSGTTLLARVLGSSSDVHLITEVAVHLKHRNCPEDRSGISDAELWRRHFTFEAWEAGRSRPVCERPIFDTAKIMSLRTQYLRLAGPKRLVIKNPFNIARVDMLKIMFPEALFVFALRAPWPTIRSATAKGNGSYTVPTQFVSKLPNDDVLRAAATWAEAVDVLSKERDDYWIVLRYDELIARPQAVISSLYHRLGMSVESIASGATLLPETRENDFSVIKYRMMVHPCRNEIFSMLAQRAPMLGYGQELCDYPGNSLRGAVRHYRDRLHQANKRRPHFGVVSFLARAFRATMRFPIRIASVGR